MSERTVSTNDTWALRGKKTVSVTCNILLVKYFAVISMAADWSGWWLLKAEVTVAIS